MASTINVKIAPLPRGEYSSSATYAKLDVVSYNGSSYMAIKAVPTGTVPTNTTYWQLLAEKPTIGEGSITTDMLADGAVTADKLDSSVSDKYAEVSGTYEDMVVGSAEQLLSTQYDTDSVPYAFRKSPYGDREFDEIVGGSIAWNQLVSNSTFPIAHSENGITNTWADNTMTIVGTASITSWIYVQRANGDNIAPNNHVYMVMSTYVPNDVRFGVLKDDGSFAYGADGQNMVLVKNDVGIRAVNFRHPANVAYNYSTKPQLFDLTQMFGSTIADYIYSLEQSSTGSGVAFFRGLFPKPYYAYNAGQLISVSGLSAHKMTGFNQWDEEWRIGEYDMANGSFVTDSTHFASKNPIPVQPNTTYYLGSSVNATFRVFYYDADKQFVGFEAIGTTNSTFTTISTAHYIQFSSTTGFYGTTYKHDICINISGERNGQYEPYESHSYALDDSLTLRGVPRLVDNKMQFDGDIYSSDGTVQRRYGIVDLGSLSWNYQSSSGNMYADNAIPNRLVGGSTICAKYDSHGFEVGSVGGLTDDKQYAFQNTLTTRIIIKDSAYTNATTFTSAMDGVYLVYKLATPTTESASPYVSPQICNEYGTEEYVSAEQSGVTMIVGHNTKYPQNLRKKIEGLPWNFSSLIAPTEVTNKATRNYTVGSYLIMNNTLYKVTSAIANGGTITVGTNVSATTIMAEILAL